MLRWKIFIPMAILLTVAGLLGSYFWSASASNRYLSALNETENAQIMLEDGLVSIKINDGSIADILGELDSKQVEEFASDSLSIERAGAGEVSPSLQGQVDLVVHEAVATREYFQANLQLQDLASRWDLEAEMIIWGDKLVAEVGDSGHSYITHCPLEEVRAP